MAHFTCRVIAAIVVHKVLNDKSACRVRATMRFCLRNESAGDKAKKLHSPRSADTLTSRIARLGDRPVEGRPENLVAEAVRGNSLALQQLLLQHYSALELHLLDRIPAEHRSLISPEDILQETFSTAFRGICQLSLDNERQFAAWLRTVAENRLADVVKSLNRKKRGGGLHRVHNRRGSSSSVFDLLEQLSAHTGPPSRLVIQGEALRALHVHVASLPEPEQCAIRGIYFEGREVDEIAADLARSPAAVRGLLHRAYKRLADCLGSSSQWLNRS